MTNPLHPHIKITTCPKCKCVYPKPLEPYIRASGSEQQPVIGLRCAACGHQSEYRLLKGLPLSIEQANAVFGALCQITKVSFLTDFNIDIVKEIQS